MTLRSAGLAVAVGSPLFALYILGVLLLLDLDSAPGQYALAVPVAIFLGFVPWGFLLDQILASGQQGAFSQQRASSQQEALSQQAPDQRAEASAGPGWLPGIIGVLDVGKGALAVGLGWAALDAGQGTMAVGLAVLAGHTASSLLSGHGRAGPVTVGALLVMAPLAGIVAVASAPPAFLAVRRNLPGGLLVTLAVIVGTSVMALIGQADYIHLAFAGPAAALMLYQYRKEPF